MYVKYSMLCKAEPGDNISHFAEEVINYRNRHSCVIIAAFNDVYIEVDESMTAKDIEWKLWIGR